MIKILIVDDALFMRKLIKDALKPLGFDIVGEAANGREAVEKFKELQPDLITMDIVMPDMTGLEALVEIRKMSKHVKVIMITAVDQRDSMIQAMEEGVSDFVVKPFTEERIVSAIEKCLTKPSTSELE